MKLERALLAAHLERPEPALCDARRERGEAGRARLRTPARDCRSRGTPAGSARLCSSCRRSARSPSSFSRARRRRPAAVKAGPEVGDKTELALVSGRLRAKPVESGETGADACRLVHARSEPPGRDDLITNVFVDFAAGFDDGERPVARRRSRGRRRRRGSRDSSDAAPVWSSEKRVGASFIPFRLRSDCDALHHRRRASTTSGVGSDSAEYIVIVRVVGVDPSTPIRRRRRRRST